MLRRRRLTFELLECRTVLDGANSAPILPPVAVGDELFFSADDGAHGYELWKSDGPVFDTRLVRDIRPGVAGSNPYALTNVNGTLFFMANDGVHGTELWRSDGTPVGTRLVKDVLPGSESGALRTWLVNLNGTLLFDATDGVHGNELWRSNGTATGTTMVKDLSPGPLGNYFYAPTNLGGTLYFADSDTSTHGTLWRTDGTTAGTVALTDLFAAERTYLISVGGTVYFRKLNDSPRTYQLWATDGSPSGTHLVKDFGNPLADSVEHPTDLNGTLYFGVNYKELWKSDGTEAGTVLVTSESSGVRFLTNVAGTLYFAGQDSRGALLWNSDGTAAGTSLVKAIPTDDPLNKLLQPVSAIDNALLFVARDATHGEELWRSDGTPGGTVMVKDINPGIGSSVGYLQAAPSIGGKFYFAATDGRRGREFWETDGTTAGTVIVKNINNRPQISENAIAATYRAGDPPVALFPATTTFSHDFTDYSGGSLTIAYVGFHGPNDRLAIQNNGTAAGKIGVADNTVTLGGAPVATFTGGGKNSPALVVTFNSQAHAAAIQALLRAITYQNVNQVNITPRLRELYVTVEDAGGRIGHASQWLDDPPVLQGGSGSVGYRVGDSPVTLLSGGLASDPDGASFADGGLDVVPNQGDAGDALQVSGNFAFDGDGRLKWKGTIIGGDYSQHPGDFPSKQNLGIYFNANATAAIVQELIRSVQFSTTGAAGQRTYSFRLTDGHYLFSDWVDATVNVTA
jgi:ELWxxDGT repeat protein